METPGNMLSGRALQFFIVLVLRRTSTTLQKAKIPLIQSQWCSIFWTWMNDMRQVCRLDPAGGVSPQARSRMGWAHGVSLQEDQPGPLCWMQPIG